MGLFDALMGGGAGNKAYKAHVQASQMFHKKEYEAGMKKYEEAHQLYEDAYAKKALNGKQMSGFALLLMRLGEFDRARGILMEAFKLKELSADEKFDIRVDYSICMWKLGNLDKAIESMENAMQIKKNSVIYTTLGMFLVDQARVTGDTARAEAFNAEAMDYDDEDAGTLDNVAQLCMLLAERAEAAGDREEARAQRAKALAYEKKAFEIKPEQATSTYFYALMLHEQGNNAEAKEVLSALDRVPISAVSQIDRATVNALKAKL